MLKDLWGTFEGLSVWHCGGNLEQNPFFWRSGACFYIDESQNLSQTPL